MVAEVLPAQSKDYDRQPPQDLAAEQSVLGGMLLSKDAIAEVVEVLRSTDFYRPAHSLIYDVVLDLYGKGEPADAVTVAAELSRRGEIARAGGAPYLHTLISSVPTAAHAGYYARIVAERAILRRLVEAGTRIVQLGYAGLGDDVDEIVDRAQAAVYEVTERRTSEDYVRLEHLLQGTLDEIDAIGSRGGSLSGVPTGFSDLDALTNGLHPGQLVIIAARPAVGKSTLGLDFARSASIKHSMASCIFSLEMSKSEIVMRLLSAEARVSLGSMRTGRMSDDDWARLARRMGEVADAPLYIDDSPNLTMMEIRAKARRLKQQQDLQLVVVDYMQLMSSPKRVENRQQEVSEISRSLKLLAKELEVPVVAISQLNRGSEQRADKKPMLSDLRESGCLTASTRLLRADTNAEVTLGELLASAATDVPVWSVDESLRVVRGTLTHAFPSGTKEVFRMRLRSGREIEATASHKFLTYDGWKPLAELAAGSRLATPRITHAPDQLVEWPDDHVVLLAHLLGDGSFVKRQPIRYASIDQANLTAVTQAARAFGVTAVRDDYPAARLTTLRLPAPFPLTHGRRNPIAAWLDGLGLLGLRSHEKHVPGAVHSMTKRQAALFLRHLWATDGSVRWDDRAGQARLYYASTSRRLVDDIAQLLLRFGVLSRIMTTTKPGYRDCYHLVIYAADNQQRFLEKIGIHGARGDIAEATVLPALRAIKGDTNVDTVPVDVWRKVRDIVAEREMTHREMASAMETPFCSSTMGKHAPRRGRLARVAAVLHDADLDLLATSEVYWDEVASIESLGEQDVFDATVLGTHNFIANGIVAHNSLEQDADMVILLYREDVFEPESPRAGEADMIVAKHRNGPTDTITVAFQGRYSRFVDMSPG